VSFHLFLQTKHSNAEITWTVNSWILKVNPSTHKLWTVRYLHGWEVHTMFKWTRNQHSTFFLHCYEKEREIKIQYIYKHVWQHMLQTRILIAYFIPTIKCTNSNVIKTFGFRMKDGPTCVWNQHRTVEFQNSDRDTHNPFSNIWEPVWPKTKRTDTPQRVF